MTPSIFYEASDMANEKIVTKKTAAKPAAPTTQTPAATPVAKKSVAKKTAATAATPSAPAPAPALTKAAAAAAAAKSAAAAAPAKAATQPAAASSKTAPKKPAKRAEPTAGKPQPPLEDKPVSLQHLANVTPEQRLDMIREAAYYRSEKRNFAEGYDAQDWADAEREIDELTAKAKEIFGSR
ncbi:DUF2934 domain-containing protein [Lamprocystis purpurea]|jgi:hypothetical protein|uniref:DUF2934 domain-containing protein n=1 Tax=Lamprocystis purpurea TaxID=61598 RepID=UPI00037794EA|nr:DUF2934 domain-containing protein [Lamprocystis purpurea]